MAKKEESVSESSSPDNRRPVYLPTECPRCHGEVLIVCENGDGDYSKIKLLCWKCGCSTRMVQDEEAFCYRREKKL